MEQKISDYYSCSHSFIIIIYLESKFQNRSDQVQEEFCM